MITHSLSRLTFLLDTIPAQLRRIAPVVFSATSDPRRWSKQEILGHLIDSATNNHHRLVRAQFEQVPVITYNQDEWVRCHQYREMNAGALIDLWAAYNMHLLALASCLSGEALARKCGTGGPEPVTLAFLVDDYVRHMEHHLAQIMSDT